MEQHIIARDEGEKEEKGEKVEEEEEEEEEDEGVVEQRLIVRDQPAGLSGLSCCQQENHLFAKLYIIVPPAKEPSSSVLPQLIFIRPLFSFLTRFVLLGPSSRQLYEAIRILFPLHETC